ncbi:hypothetical protein CEP54_016097 [Fusarium duplospermum]|uniref:Uncharacterized protein n=1 Tax=Fusarium duplospermum TaxID=1325734 RepID=A0A428NIB4_9HYPO|nr:hypothetical protein CEP54_016097 [Fusarium duplospermum]
MDNLYLPGIVGLDTEHATQRVAGREVVRLAPLLQRPDLPDLFPKLLDCLKDKRSLIPRVAEVRKWKVVNVDHWKPQVFRHEPNAALPVSQGHLNAVVLLHDCGMVIFADNNGKELV